ncbi:hypothetical protein [Oceanithermus sp.]|nr:hypothetical protein [Oceanithermus sp.]
MINNPTLRLVPLALVLSLLSLSACRREAKAPPGMVKIDGNAV